MNTRGWELESGGWKIETKVVSIERKADQDGNLKARFASPSLLNPQQEQDQNREGQDHCN